MSKAAVWYNWYPAVYNEVFSLLIYSWTWTNRAIIIAKLFNIYGNINLLRFPHIIRLNSFIANLQREYPILDSQLLPRYCMRLEGSFAKILNRSDVVQEGCLKYMFQDIGSCALCVKEEVWGCDSGVMGRVKWYCYREYSYTLFEIWMNSDKFNKLFL